MKGEVGTAFAEALSAMFPSWLLALPLVSFAIQPLTVQEQDIWTPSVSLSEPNYLVGLLEQWDVVEVMKLTGHGEGLDEIRKIQVFGE
jgi:leucyl aminopeptidase